MTDRAVLDQPVERWYEVYLFDLDGTIYLGDELLPGAAVTIAAIRAAGKTVRFLSNNPTKTPQQYAAKLTALGIATPTEDIVTSLTTTIWWLQRYHRAATLYPIGEQPLIDSLEAAGFTLSDDPSAIDIVIASYDRGFTYAKLQVAFDALWRERRAILISTNPDRYCPFPGGRGQPDAAAITAAIEACTGVSCLATMGKPSALMAEAGLNGLNVAPGDVIMTGDRLSTDIAMALSAGLEAAVVFTGETSVGDLGPQHTGVRRLEHIGQLLPASQ
ncbi:MAG: HAD-IIA family hydrolase [Propionibacteriaceae bacterium]|nr:HAD-IIA family hydrolase [Propionibacteriaceae bacterium]